MIETAVVFDCEGEALLGVVSAPARPTETAVLIVVGGPQYRVGSHRQFVQMARMLANEGVTAMRFDVRGMGDSEGAQRGYEFIDRDIGAAIDALQQAQPNIRRVVLWGLCGGASAALLYLRATGDLRVQGLVLVNPWVRSELTLARARVKHYYVQRLLKREFWLKLIQGGVALGALGEFLGSARTSLSSGRAAAGVAGDAATSLADRMVDTWARFAGPTLVVLSGNDYTAKEFLEATLADSRWAPLMARSATTRLDLAEADHTFSEPLAQQAMEESTLRWLKSALLAATSP